MAKFGYILGLDLGVQSVGWAIIPVNPKKGTELRLGVRCFDSGTGTESEIEQGKDESRNLKRRMARSIRRNQWRRKRRTLKLFNLLRNNGLLPMGKGPGDTPEDRQDLINELDVKLSHKLSLDGDRIAAHLLPYKLRALALDKKLEPFALGRALLHLSQRRGFLSNKKTSGGKDEDEGQIKKDISDLAKEIAEKGFRTLGEFFASLDPEEKRIRQRWTGRQMFLDEFNAIWKVQAKKNPALTEELREKIHHALFFQRPLKSQKHLIGKCELEKGKRRAPLASMEAQRFRYWQKILDMIVQLPNGESRPLTHDEQDRLATALEHEEKMTFAAIRKLLGMTKPKGAYKFNLELEDVKDLRGNSSSARIMEIIPQRWAAMPDEERDSLINEILQFESEDALAKRLQKVFGFDSSTASQLAAIDLERDHAKLSRQAIRKILPVMQEKRIRFMAARKKVYGEPIVRDIKDLREFVTIHEKRYGEEFQKNVLPLFHLAETLHETDDKTDGKVIAKIKLQIKESVQSLLIFTESDKKRYDEPLRKKIQGILEHFKDGLDFLPPVLQAVKDLKNPVVTRTLTEVRKVVNAIIRKYGKPDIIRVELARDMKKSRADREKLSKEIRQQEKKREDARKTILKETGNREPRSGEIQKILLAEECGWMCPYTGKTITPKNLLGPSPQFDIEHTLPFSRSLDNSYANKTLCDVHENRHVKKNQTPFEAYGSDPQRWHEIMSRVQNFIGPKKAVEAKLRRFQMKEIPEGFTSRMLNDTRYISRLAGDYLGLLYGGRSDANGKLRIQVSSGGMTAWLRDEWDMNEILGDGGEKNREDHRHHAIDAAVIAMCDTGTVQKLEQSAEKAEQQSGHRRFAKGIVEEPMPNFKRLISEAKDRINVSFRADRKVGGGFHKETNYSRSQQYRDKNGKIQECRHIRKPIIGMSEGDVQNIVDPTIRDLVLQKLEGFGMKDAKKLPESELPYIRTKDDRVIPIRKARIRDNKAVMSLGKSEKTQRHVAPGNNHHMEIVAVLDAAGNEVKWEGVIVSMYDAYQRRRRKEKIVCRDHGPGKRFKFSLAGGEYIIVTTPKGEERLCLVKSPSDNDIGCRLHSDARPQKDFFSSPDRKEYRFSLKKLFEWKAKKVAVDFLGEIHPAND